eukprot:COSAG04_NODE_542_length_12865_cov_44.119693_8_plen_143_part_00
MLAEPSNLLEQPDLGPEAGEGLRGQPPPGAGLPRRHYAVPWSSTPAIMPCQEEQRKDPRVTATRAEDKNEYDRQWKYIKNHPDCESVPPKRQKSSPFPGVSWDVGKSKWTARVTRDGKSKNVGRFEKAEDADAAVKAAKAAP